MTREPISAGRPPARPPLALPATPRASPRCCAPNTPTLPTTTTTLAPTVWLRQARRRRARLPGRLQGAVRAQPAAGAAGARRLWARRLPGGRCGVGRGRRGGRRSCRRVLEGGCCRPAASGSEPAPAPRAHLGTHPAPRPCSRSLLPGGAQEQGAGGPHEAAGPAGRDRHRVCAGGRAVGGMAGEGRAVQGELRRLLGRRGQREPPRRLRRRKRRRGSFEEASTVPPGPPPRPPPPPQRPRSAPPCPTCATTWWAPSRASAGRRRCPRRTARWSTAPRGAPPWRGGVALALAGGRVPRRRPVSGWAYRAWLSALLVGLAQLAYGVPPPPAPPRSAADDDGVASDSGDEVDDPNMPGGRRVNPKKQRQRVGGRPAGPGGRADAA